MSRCTGHCCRDFTLFQPSHYDLERLYMAQLGMEPGPWNGWVFLGSDGAPVNVQIVGGARELSRLLELFVPSRVDTLPNGRPEQKYRCRAQDPVTGDCTIYDTRPQLCRGFPYRGSDCDFKGCTLAPQPSMEASCAESPC